VPTVLDRAPGLQSGAAATVGATMRAAARPLISKPALRVLRDATLSSARIAGGISIPRMSHGGAAEWGSAPPVL
jgi:hypothetical protein